MGNQLAGTTLVHDNSATVCVCMFFWTGKQDWSFFGDFSITFKAIIQSSFQNKALVLSNSLPEGERFTKLCYVCFLMGLVN